MKKLFYEGCAKKTSATVTWKPVSAQALSSFKSTRPPIRVWFWQKLPDHQRVNVEIQGLQSTWAYRNGVPYVVWEPAMKSFEATTPISFGQEGNFLMCYSDEGHFENGEFLGYDDKGNAVWETVWIPNVQASPYEYQGGSFIDVGGNLIEIGFWQTTSTRIRDLYTDDDYEYSDFNGNYKLSIEEGGSGSWVEVFAQEFRELPQDLLVECGDCRSPECLKIFSNDLTTFVCSCREASGNIVIEDPN